VQKALMTSGWIVDSSANHRRFWRDLRSVDGLRKGGLRHETGVAVRTNIHASARLMTASGGGIGGGGNVIVCLQ
jgi:hypothetical protein